jgi:hypothetical protein
VNTTKAATSNLSDLFIFRLFLFSIDFNVWTTEHGNNWGAIQNAGIKPAGAADVASLWRWCSEISRWPTGGRRKREGASLGRCRFLQLPGCPFPLRLRWLIQRKTRTI